MQRYFISERKQDIMYLEPDDVFHTKKVMRNNVGDQVVCIDHMGHNYVCEIINIDNGQLQIVKSIENFTELDVHITLIYAVPKGDKFEMVLQKATELGVHRIVPLQANRCVVKTNYDKFNKKKKRYQKIVKEASEQSYRNCIPIIEDVIYVHDIHKYLGTYNIVAYEEDAKNGDQSTFKNVIEQLHKEDSITIIVGCEGGFEQNEIEAMQQIDIQSCSLGKRILRSETAPLYMLSVIGYMRELGG